MIIRDSAGGHYRVTDAGPGLEHCWNGVPVKRVAGAFVPKANARRQLVRKAATVVVAFDAVKVVGN